MLSMIICVLTSAGITLLLGFCSDLPYWESILPISVLGGVAAVYLVMQDV